MSTLSPDARSIRDIDSSRSLRRRIVVAGFLLLVLSIVRTAWLGDDAFISFRTATNVLAGKGLVWNVGERVQAFTHPLWLAVCSTALTGEVYYTAIAVSAVITLAGVALLVSRLASSTGAIVFSFAALLSSKAFIDYSTSGLENTLSHLLVMIFVWQWWSGVHDRTHLLRLSFVGCLCMLNRLDVGLVVAPGLAQAAWRLGPRKAIGPLVVGMLPLLVWEAFSVFYYGSLIPNTAYAKLTTTAVPAAARLERGGAYVYRTLIQDPVTIAVMGLALSALARERRREDWPLLAGMALYFGYVVRIGGDFMMGRFWSVPFVVSVVLLARAHWITPLRRGVQIAAAIVVLGLISPWEPALVSGYGYAYVRNWLDPTPRRQLDELPHLSIRQIVDERRASYEALGLLKVLVRGAPDHEWRSDGLDLKSRGRQVVVRGGIGMVGFYAGPEVHIIDSYGLADPLLARLPSGSTASPVGHYVRPLPEGYLDTIVTGTNNSATRASPPITTRCTWSLPATCGVGNGCAPSRHFLPAATTTTCNGLSISGSATRAARWPTLSSCRASWNRRQASRR